MWPSVTISEHPGTSHAEIGTVYKNRDLSLVIGHLIHYRFGYFRPLLTGAIQSDLLLERDKTSGKIEQVLVNARRLEIEPLVEACENELRTRGSLNLSGAGFSCRAVRALTAQVHDT